MFSAHINKTFRICNQTEFFWIACKYVRIVKFSFTFWYLQGKAQKRKTCTKPVPFNFSQSQTRNKKGTEAVSEPSTESGNPTTHPTRTPAKTLSVSRHETKTGAAAQNAASGGNISECANPEVTNNVSVSTGKGNDIISAIQKDLSTKLGNITLSHTQHTKDERFSFKASGFEAQADPNTKKTIQTLLSADCKTGECYDNQG